MPENGVIGLVTNNTTPSAPASGYAKMTVSDKGIPTFTTSDGVAHTAREVLTANRTYYVATTGSDSNNGLTVGTPFLTISKAINVIRSLDCSIYTPTIQLADGTYTEAVSISTPLVGGATLIITGNVSTPANCILSATSGTSFAVANGAIVILNGVELRSTSGISINITENAKISLGNSVRFGTAAAYQIYVASGGSFTGSSYSIVGQASVHLYVESGGKVGYTATAITLSGTLTFWKFVVCQVGGLISDWTSTWTGGTITGQRYAADMCGVINTYGAGASHYPGNSAGTTATGGQYV